MKRPSGQRTAKPSLPESTNTDKQQEEATWNKLAPNQESTIPMTRAIAPESGVCVTCIIAGKCHNC